MSGACRAHSYGMEEIHLSAVLQINVELVGTSSGIPLHVLRIIGFVDTYLNGPDVPNFFSLSLMWIFAITVSRQLIYF